jgi:hypothetical protein
VTATASNTVTYTDTSDDLMVIVTDKPCQPPKVKVVGMQGDQMSLCKKLPQMQPNP